ncbi:MAG: DUF3597 domain-containing protein [Chloroflexi bacterium]|nr:DUF3597 domain-containing protein [Chloroflexota bacterium]
MGFFSTILEKLGLKKEEPAAPATPAPAQPAAPASSGPSGQPPATVASIVRPTSSAPAAAEKEGLDSLRTAEPAVQAISEVDVMKKLEDMAKGSELDWKVSIVDMLKILGIDSSKDSRIELAKELGCPDDLIGGDYSKMNVWLHKEVLKRVAQNGGNIPKSMLD